MEEQTYQPKSMLKHFKLLISIVLLLAAVALAAYSYATLRESAYIFDGPTTISVAGVGEVVARPDIGMFSFSVRAEAEDPMTAQEDSAQAINAIMTYLEGEGGVEEADIKTTSYNLSPRYEFIQEICEPGFCPPGRQELVGYSVMQTISVKVRDTDRAGGLISGVGERGATNISGLSFTIDDEEALKAQARAHAIENAKENAEELTDELGVRIVRIVGFSEDDHGFYPQFSRGFGGDFDEAAIMAVPDIPTGENTITSRVILIYEVR